MRRIRDLGRHDEVRAGRPGDHGPLRRFTLLLPQSDFQCLELLSAEQAAQWGLIWRCVEDAEFAGVVDALARQLAAAPTRGLARTKQAIYESWGRSLEQQLDTERDFQSELGRTADYAEGVAAFGEKRAPKFTGQ